jgi:2-methylcitrate dehydratase PrpD
MASFENFVLETNYEDLPADVLAIIKRSVLDTFGVAIVGSTTEISNIVSTYALRHWCAGSDGPTARVMFKGSSLSPEGAAFVGAFSIDSIDGHDGYSPAKGHAGSAILPALLAFCEDRKASGNPVSGREFLAAMAVGYEVSYRAGLALHATTPDYHTSGAWTAVGVAAMGARLLGLSGEQLRHAIGIAEYHGPRSQMMRCIDHPSMLRDGVGWGAPTGVSAAYMAQAGFTGAPAITVEQQDAAEYWQDLGDDWKIYHTNYKRYPVCRWAHPAIDAAMDLMSDNKLSSQDVERVRIQTFHNATRLAGHDPKTVDEITYAIAFPTATMIARGKIGIPELSPEILDDAEVHRISMATELVETEYFNKISVGERWGDVTLYLKDGRELQSPPRKPKGDQHDDPLSEEEIIGKFHAFADPVIGASRANALKLAIDCMDGEDANINWLDELVFAPAG